MKRIMAFAALICTTTILVSQIPEIAVGPEIPLRQSDEYQGLLHSDESGYTIYLYERSGKGILGEAGRNLIIEKYDDAFNQVYSYEYGEKGTITVDLISTGKSFAWTVIEKVGSYKYTYKLIPIALNGKQGRAQKLYTLDIGKSSDIPKTRMLVSPDSTKVGFVTLVDNNSKKDELELYCAVASDQGDILWDDWPRLRGNQKQYEIQDVILNNDGEFIFLTKYNKDEKAKETVKNRNDEKIAGYSMQIIQVHPDLKKVQRYPIEVDQQFVHEAAIQIDPLTDDIICSGLISTKEGGNINGAFYTRYDSDYNQVVTNNREFSKNELISFDKAKVDVNLKEGKSGLDDDFNIRELVVLPNGSTIMIAEEVYTRTTTNNLNPVNAAGTFNRFNNRSESTTLHANDIVLVDISPEGDISNVDIIPKKQSVQVARGVFRAIGSADLFLKDDYFLSYSQINIGNTLMLMYNERDSNFDRETSRRRNITTGRDLRTAALDISSNSISQISPLFDELGDDYVMATNRSKKVGENQFFMTLVDPRSRRIRHVRLAVMTF